MARPAAYAKRASWSSVGVVALAAVRLVALTFESGAPLEAAIRERGETDKGERCNQVNGIRNTLRGVPTDPKHHGSLDQQCKGPNGATVRIAPEAFSGSSSSGDTVASRTVPSANPNAARVPSKGAYGPARET